MIKKGGFTIIELLVTISIIAILVAVSLPRYSTLTASSSFAAEVENLTNCIQRAQQAVLASPTNVGSSVRFSSVTLQSQSTDTLTCSYALYPAQDASQQAITVTQLQTNSVYLPRLNTPSNTSVSVTPITMQELTAPLATSLTTPYAVTLFFGSKEGGVPVLLCAQPSSTSASCATSFLPSVYGEGFTTSLSVADPTTLSAVTPVQGVVTIGQLGLPIQFTNK